MDMNLQWRKAAYSSGNGGNCIEVATADRTVAVRDSKDPDGPRLAFEARAWQAFAAKVKGKRSYASCGAPATMSAVPVSIPPEVPAGGIDDLCRGRPHRLP